MHPLSTLTTDQYELFKDNIPFVRLSKTYQDALATTLALGVHHIWIDALCIIQDSPEDWNKESQKMGQYYGNAHLTICVASADDVHAGFRTRSPGLYEPLHLRQLFPSGEVGNLLISRGIQKYRSWISKGVHYSLGLWQANVEVSQLASRAWVFQERLLSPRKIYFGKENLFWECRRSRHAEGGEYSLGGQTSSLTDMAASIVTVQDWYDLVEMYTARRLTRQSDRLRAIAGLAVPFKEVLQEDYVAGLWTHDLHYGLNWRLEGGTLHDQDAKALFPSWSWASSSGPVCFGEPHTNAESEEKSALKLRSVTGRSPNDPYGATSQTHLHLTGRVRRTSLRQEEPLSLFASDDIKGTETHTAANGAVGTYFDDSSIPRHGEHFWTLQLCKIEPTAGPSIPMSYRVIVMEAVEDRKEGKARFRRIGAALVFHDGSGLDM